MESLLAHIALIFLVTLIPYFGFTIPNLRQMTITSFPLDTYSYLTFSETAAIENAISAAIFKMARSAGIHLINCALLRHFLAYHSYLYGAAKGDFYHLYVSHPAVDIG